MSPMRVLHVTATYDPSVNGVAITVDKLREELTTQGVDVTVLAPRSARITKEASNIIRFSSLPNPFNQDYPIPLYPGLHTVLKLLRGDRPDIVHTHHPFYIGLLARFIARYFDVPLVYTYHTRYDMHLGSYLSFLPPDLATGMIRNNVDAFCKTADLVLSPSRAVAQGLMHRLPYLNVAVLPTGLSEIPQSTLTRTEIRKRLQIPMHKTVLLTVCRVAIEKNLPLLIQAIRQLDEQYVLMVVGGGIFLQTLKSLARQEGVLHKIRFMGMVPRDELGTYYQAADIFVFPSVTETQGIVFLEALSFGLPIVSVESDASREWVAPDVGILTQNDPLSLSHGIRMMNQKDRATIEPRAVAVTKTHTFTSSTKLLVDQYQTLIHQHTLSKKLLQTGWQSWSPRPRSILRVPAWNYAPTKDTFLPHFQKSFDRKPPAKGWCSWYAFGPHIYEKRLLAQTEWFVRHPEPPIDYIIVDDGWTKCGDWMSADMSKFPSGMHELSTQIHALGKKSGIWVAPFWVEPDSKLFNLHKDWVVKNGPFYADGHQAVPFGQFFYPRYILDVRIPEVIDYIFQCLDYLLVECKFELLKMDFLYSIYFIPGISTKEAGHVLNSFFREVRRRYPHVYTIACGAPLTPAVGVVDSMRIGPDVISPGIERIPVLNTLVHTYKVNLVLHNIKTRGWTREYWNPDPDVFVCSPKLGIRDSKLRELRDAIAKLKGNMFLGDDMTALPQARIQDMILPLFQ